MTMSTSKRVAMYVLPVVALSIALNIPKFMEATATVNENDTVTIEMAEMRKQPTYVLYFTISQGRTREVQYRALCPRYGTKLSNSQVES